MRIEPLTLDHLQKIELQPEQACMAEHIRSEDYFKAVTSSILPCFAAVHEGVVLGCYGAIWVWEGRCIVWVWLSRHAGKYMRRVHREAARYVDSLNVRRIEATVRSGFSEGIHWPLMLGFKHEGHMESFFADGSDAELFAKVNHVNI